MAYTRRINVAANSEVIAGIQNKYNNAGEDYNHLATIEELLKTGHIAEAKNMMPFGQSLQYNSDPKGYLARLHKSVGDVQKEKDTYSGQLSYYNNRGKSLEGHNTLEDAIGIYRNKDRLKGLKDSAAFISELKKTMAAVGYAKTAGGTYSSNNALLATHDFTKLSGLMGIGGGKKVNAGGDEEGGGKSVAAGVTGGGPRVVNINFKNMVEKLDIHASGVY